MRMNAIRMLFVTVAALSLTIFPSVSQAEMNLDPIGTLSLIANEKADGQMNQEEALIYSFQALFDPDQVPIELTKEGVVDRPISATPLILEAMTKWDTLSSETQEIISSYVDVPKFIEIPMESRLQDKARVPRPGGFDTPNTYQTEHFNIKWGNSGGVLNTHIHALGDILEIAYEKEVDDLGYGPPTNGDQYYVDIYIANTDDGAPAISFQGAYTTMYEDNPLMAYFVVHPDIITWAPAAQEISAHEFFHVLQFAIIVEHGWHCYTGYDSTWWWEATAVWMEDVVFPEVNYYVSFLNIYADKPWESLHSRVDFYYQYSRVLWAKFLDEYHGGLDAIQDIWFSCDSRGVLYGTDEYLLDQDSSLKKGFGEFMAVNATMDYIDGGLYDDMALLDTHGDYPVLVETIDKDYRPRYLGANFIRFLPDMSKGDSLRVGFDGQDTAYGKNIQWRVMLVGIQSRTEYGVTHLTLDEDNYGELVIPDFGTEYTEVILIPTVVKYNYSASTIKGVDYKYAADIETSDSDDDDSAGDDDDSGGGCSL